MKQILRSLVSISFVTCGPSFAATSTFEDLALSPNSYENGSNLSPAGSFASGGNAFANAYNAIYGSWSGFAYSNVNDTTTAGYRNQYAAITGTGFGEAGNYAVTYGDTATITLAAGQRPESVYVTNTTYAYLTMRYGDAYGFTKKFGGPTGNDADYFTVTFTGRDAGGAKTGAVEFALADYRGATDYIVDVWTLVDLTPLGQAATISLSYASSDVGAFGINTPTYAALDNLVAVPEPASVGLLSVASGAAMLRRRRAQA